MEPFTCHTVTTWAAYNACKFENKLHISEMKEKLCIVLGLFIHSWKNNDYTVEASSSAKYILCKQHTVFLEMVMKYAWLFDYEQNHKGPALSIMWSGVQHSVAQQRNGYGIGLTTQRLWVQLPAIEPSGVTGQLADTPTCGLPTRGLVN